MAEKENDIRQEITTETSGQTFHSDEVQDIMGRRPAWILRWGVTVLVGILVGIIIACIVIKYPQTVTAAITLTSDCPPSDLAARTEGILDSVYVSDGDTVTRGELLALVASTADYPDVVTVESHIGRWQSTGFRMTAGAMDSLLLLNPSLGNLQQYWTECRTVCLDYSDYLSIDRTGRKQELLSEQVRRSGEYCRRLESRRATMVLELELEGRKVSRDSLLLSLGAISEKEYEATRQGYISMKSSLEGFDATMASAHLDRLQLEQQILELDTQRSEEEAEHRRKLEQAMRNLEGQLALWREKYAVTAPYGGIVSLQNVWGKGQRVNAGDIIASIAPAGEMEVMGRLKVPSASFGKVTEGQQVNIRLNGFPYLEYGILKGTVTVISRIPEKTEEGISYTVDVELPEGLTSTYHRTFPFVQNMDGTADIITEDLRLIDRFIQPVRSLFVNR